MTVPTVDSGPPGDRTGGDYGMLVHMFISIFSSHSPAAHGVHLIVYWAGLPDLDSY